MFMLTYMFMYICLLYLFFCLCTYGLYVCTCMMFTCKFVYNEEQLYKSKTYTSENNKINNTLYVDYSDNTIYPIIELNLFR